MRVLLFGGTGHVGSALIRHWRTKGYELIVVSRQGGDFRWDGKTLGNWEEAVEGADVVVNLAGRSVNCRYSEVNLKEMMDSRVDSTRAVGQAISNAKNPPRLWLQASTATIYAHRFDSPNDEATGIIGGNEPDVPKMWVRSVDIAKAWEAELAAAETPRTRKIALRSAMTMSPDKTSIFDVLTGLARRGLGGPIAGGKQFISWIHEDDFCAALDFLIAREDIAGAVNVCSPNPLPQSEFMGIQRSALGVKVGLPASRWMIEAGCFLMRTESELVLKSRRVVPGRLLKEGFKFRYPDWRQAAEDLAAKLSRRH